MPLPALFCSVVETLLAKKGPDSDRLFLGSRSLINAPKIRTMADSAISDASNRLGASTQAPEGLVFG